MGDVAERRLRNQQITAESRSGSVAAAVAHLGAIQAQDYTSALWAIGLRAGVSEAEVERAIAKREIVRTWPMRGTVHFVAAQDVHWLLELLTPRILAAGVHRAEQLGLDAQTLGRCRDLFHEALAGGQQLTRAELLGVLEAAGIRTDAHRSYHIVWRLAQERLICFGPRAGKQPTFVLLEEWVQQPRRLERAEALRELAVRYFTSHGPATLQDFVWWSGLRISEARVAIESAPVAREVINGAPVWCANDGGNVAGARPSAQLLPAFDEYLLGYKDRAAVLDPAYAPRIVPGGNGIFLPIAVVNGRVIGTWKRVRKSKSALVTVSPFDALSAAKCKQLHGAAADYAEFLGTPLVLQFADASSHRSSQIA